MRVPKLLKLCCMVIIRMMHKRRMQSIMPWKKTHVWFEMTKQTVNVTMTIFIPLLPFERPPKSLMRLNFPFPSDETIS